MEHSVFALKGILVHTPAFDSIEYHENKYVVCKAGHCVGIFDTLPEEYSNIRVYDVAGRLVAALDTDESEVALDTSGTDTNIFIVAAVLADNTTGTLKIARR